MITFMSFSIVCLTVAAAYGVDGMRYLRRGNHMLVDAQRLLLQQSHPELQLVDGQDEAEQIEQPAVHLMQQPYTPALTQFIVGSVNTVLASVWLLAAVGLQVLAWQ